MGNIIISLLIFIIFILLVIIQIFEWSLKRKIILARQKLKIKQPFIDSGLFNLALTSKSLSKEEISKFPKELKKSFETGKKLDYVRIILFFVLIVLLAITFLSQ